MISIIIPAYNEESVIERTLRSVLAAIAHEPGEVIVVCNGCHDQTADRARMFGERVQVLELVQGSKTGALNAGDRAATGFPRFFLDADIEVSENAFSEVAKVLRGGTIHAAAPEMRCVTDGVSWPVRAFYQTWLNRPYHTQGHIGSGFVGLSEAGRSRFKEFSNIIADDEFVRRQFLPEERVVVDSAWFSIRTPKDLRSLIKVKTRSRLGTLQLHANYPELRKRAGAKAPLINDWTDWFRPSFWTFVFITIIVHCRAHQQWKKKQINHWERDESSR